MACCTVNTCCCGCTLRRGTLIIGWLSFITYIAQSIAIVLSENWLSNDAGILDCYGPLILYLFETMLSMALIQGTRKRNPQCLKTWVYVTSFMLVVGITLGLVAVFIVDNIGLIISITVSSFLQVYFIIVVRSYAIQIEVENITQLPVIFQTQVGLPKNDRYPGIAAPQQGFVPQPPPYNAVDGYAYNVSGERGYTAKF